LQLLEEAMTSYDEPIFDFSWKESAPEGMSIYISPL